MQATSSKNSYYIKVQHCSQAWIEIFVCRFLFRVLGPWEKKEVLIYCSHWSWSHVGYCVSFTAKIQFSGHHDHEQFQSFLRQAIVSLIKKKPWNIEIKVQALVFIAWDWKLFWHRKKNEIGMKRGREDGRKSKWEKEIEIEFYIDNISTKKQLRWFFCMY